MAKHRKVPPPQPLGYGATIPAKPSITDFGDLRLSFKYLDCQSNSKFKLQNVDAAYVAKLMVRLKDICGNRWVELTASRSETLRIHPIDFSETTEPNGFSHLNEQFKAAPAWQFNVSVNEHGRVHGIFLHETFYVCWLDPEHNLYD